MVVVKAIRELMVRELQLSAVLFILVGMILAILALCEPTHDRSTCLGWLAGVSAGILSIRIEREFSWLRENPML